MASYFRCSFDKDDRDEYATFIAYEMMNHSIKFTAVVKCEVIHLHKLLEVKGVAQDPLVMYEDNSSVNQSLQDQPSRERFAQSMCCSPGFKNLADVGTYLHKLMFNGSALRLVDTAVTALEFCTLSRAVIRFYMWVSMKIFYPISLGFCSYMVFR